MHFFEKIVLTLAYLMLYACGIVYLFAHYRITGAEGPFIAELSTKN
jgi:hypothetical protein